jgi:hypothetical protein
MQLEPQSNLVSDALAAEPRRRGQNPPVAVRSTVGQPEEAVVVVERVLQIDPARDRRPD